MDGSCRGRRAGGAEGLKLMESEPVDLVISDMRMPEMDGAGFLAAVRERWPDTVRILLTGYADITSTVTAINKGEIYRYIAKPWDDNDVRLCIRGALERKAMQFETRRLEELTRRQNNELRELNGALETKVAERTENLRKVLRSLTHANEKLKAGFVTSIKVFSNLLELRGGALAGHSRRVADLARRIAVQMNMSSRETQTVMLAGLLHDIGKIGLPDALNGKPEVLMTAEESARVRKAAASGDAALMPLDDAQDAAVVLHSRHEQFDGSGYPDRLSGDMIPLGARILAVANDFDALQAGTMLARSLSTTDALEHIIAGAGRRYDPLVAEALRAALQGHIHQEPDEQLVASANLLPGMRLSRDLASPAGVLLLAAGHSLEPRHIERIRVLEQAEGMVLDIHIRRKPD
jgi:response regulator RpfG family c-di-GMP phosphodiesterase